MALDTSPVLAHGPRPLALKPKAPPPVLLRIAAFLLAVLLVLGALPAMRRADRAVAEGRSRSVVLYESVRPWLAILAAAAIGTWLLLSR
ncbi:hypothetical protein OMR07_02280 [Methylobacterium organophilum]|nr:hypothetical protein [Methylobacterium organophilum]